MPKLEILSGKREGETIDLPTDGVDIGNRKNAKLSIRDPWISWNHAKIVFEDGRFVIEDMGSSNGTCVNGKKVTRQPLQAFDEILLGKTRIRFIEHEGQAAPMGEPDAAGSTVRLNRADMPFPPGLLDASEKVAALERERDELRKKLDVLERFLEVTPDERAALARSAGGAAPPPPVVAASAGAGVDSAAAEKARQEAVAKLVELEGKLTAAEVRAVEAENRLKGSVDEKKKELAKLKAKHEEETQTLRLEKATAEDARARAEQKAEDLARKVESAAADANARADKLAKELETARKSAIDADARATKLEQKLDEARRATGRLSASGAQGNPELDALKVELAQTKAEREEWQRKNQETREEIDRISMEQIELEDQLKKRIEELELQLKQKS